MGGTQGELFPDDRYTPISRRTDPETSQQAALRTRVRIGRLKGQMLEQFNLDRERTALEAAHDAVEKYGGSVESHRKRAEELTRDGLLEYGKVRSCYITLHKATTYRVKDQT